MARCTVFNLQSIVNLTAAKLFPVGDNEKKHDLIRVKYPAHKTRQQDYGVD